MGFVNGEQGELASSRRSVHQGAAQKKAREKKKRAARKSALFSFFCALFSALRPD